jgi:hypothetical protein
MARSLENHFSSVVNLNVTRCEMTVIFQAQTGRLYDCPRRDQMITAVHDRNIDLYRRCVNIIALE